MSTSLKRISSAETFLELLPICRSNYSFTICRFRILVIHEHAYLQAQLLFFEAKVDYFFNKWLYKMRTPVKRISSSETFLEVIPICCRNYNFTICRFHLIVVYENAYLHAQLSLFEVKIAIQTVHTC